jgi:hypothetical protein
MIGTDSSSTTVLHSDFKEATLHYWATIAKWLQHKTTIVNRLWNAHVAGEIGELLTPGHLRKPEIRALSEKSGLELMNFLLEEPLRQQKIRQTKRPKAFSTKGKTSLALFISLTNLFCRHHYSGKAP